MPINRPGTNLLEDRKIGAGQEQAEIGNGYNTSQIQSFFNAHRLWFFTFFDLEAISTPGLGKCDSPTGDSVLRKDK